MAERGSDDPPGPGDGFGGGSTKPVPYAPFEGTAARMPPSPVVVVSHGARTPAVGVATRVHRATWKRVGVAFAVALGLGGGSAAGTFSVARRLEASPALAAGLFVAVGVLVGFGGAWLVLRGIGRKS